MSTLTAPPRIIDLEGAFNALVAWTRDLNAPGLIVGISGTDSILTFLIAAKAMEQAGKPQRAIGVHYGRPFPPEGKTAQDVERILKASPNFNFASRVIVPWLRQQAPQAIVEIDDSFDYTDDHLRWADLFRRSLNGAMKRAPLPAGENYWVAGTRNATEDALGAYSNISGAASVQPIAGLWKHEVLKMCARLGVPQQAIESSRQVDCDCGRFDLAARHIEEIDAVLMARQGLIDAGWPGRHIAPDLLAKLEAFVDEQTAYAGFKKQIPYKPPAGVIP